MSTLRTVLPGCLALLAGAMLSISASAAPEGKMQISKGSKPSLRAILLRKAIAGADRLEVKPIADGQTEGRWPVSISGADKIAVLAGLIDFDDAQGTDPCACGGDSTITFYKGGKVLAEVTHAEGTNLRWNKWKGGAASWFTPACALAWPKWFDANGYPAYEKMRLEKAAANEIYQKRENAFFMQLPTAARKPFAALERSYEKVSGNGEGMAAETGKERLNQAARVFLSASGEPFDVGLALCKAMGTLETEDKSRMRMICMNEQIAQLAFSQIGTDYLASIFEAAVADRQASFGAARLFLFYKLHRKLPEVTRDHLAPGFLKVVIERANVEDAQYALAELNGIAALPVTEALRDVAEGRIKPISPERRVDQEPALRYVAVLALARRGDVQAKSLVESLAGKSADKSDLAALAIARCFLGEQGTIRPEHFQLRSWALGYAGIAALERQGDKEALDVMITGSTHHSWSLVRQEAVHAIQRMTGNIWYHAQPNENEDWYGKDIREWWKTAKDGWKPPTCAGN